MSKVDIKDKIYTYNLIQYNCIYSHCFKHIYLCVLKHDQYTHIIVKCKMAVRLLKNFNKFQKPSPLLSSECKTKSQF